MKGENRHKIFVILVGIFITSCALSFFTPERYECENDFLTVDDAMLPAGWEIELQGNLITQSKQGAKMAYQVIMRNGDAFSVHNVYYYSHNWLAFFHFWNDRESYFPSIGWQWAELKSATDMKIGASQSSIQCGISNDLYLDDKCTAILRYGPYISNFSSSIQDDVMTKREFQEIVISIDGLFSACIMDDGR